MDELKIQEEFDLKQFINGSDETGTPDTEVNTEENKNEPTDIIEYKEIEEPCVALTIMSENQLTDTEVFVKRGIKYSIKAFFSAIVLTIMNMFI